MKIISWNCNGAFRNKFKFLEKFDADILIVQECENPELYIKQVDKTFLENYLWTGKNKNKGLGVFAKKGIKIEKLNEWSNIFEGHEVNFFLPILINEKQKLVAVWAHQNNSPTFEYIGQFWKYLKINKKEIDDTIFIGDFNSNSIWDLWDRWWNHSDVVKILKEHNIESAYHNFFLEEQGSETKKTFYLQKNKFKSYHIDHCFLPNFLISSIENISIENFKNWSHVSDHIPLVITLRNFF